MAELIRTAAAQITITRLFTALRTGCCALLVCCALTNPNEGWAQSYPSKLIRHIIPYSSGGSVDIVARIMAPPLAGRLGQQVVVDNRPGGSAIIASELLARAPADGYTIMTANIAHGANPYLHRKLPYDTTKDFVPVALIALIPNLLLTHPSVPVRSVKELIALAKTRPGQLTYGSAGIGTVNHLTMALFAKVTKTDFIHVPYKGGGPLVTDLVAGHIDIAFVGIPPTLSYVKAGRLRALAISSISNKRSPTMPQIPTMAEAGVPDFEVSDWHGVLAPAGTPRPVIERLNKEINAVLAEADVRERIEGLGAEVGGGSPEHLAKLIERELALWGRVMAGFRAE